MPLHLSARLSTVANFTETRNSVFELYASIRFNFQTVFPYFGHFRMIKSEVDFRLQQPAFLLR